MKSLFLRTYLAVIAFALISFFLILQFIVDPAIEHDTWGFFKEDALSEYQALKEILDETPQEKWQNLVEEYESLYSNQIDLVTLESIEDQQQRNSLQKPGLQQLSSGIEEDPWRMHFNLPESPYALKITDDIFNDEDDADTDAALAVTHSERLETYLPWILISLAQLVGVILLVRMIKSPVDKLVETTEKFGAGDLNIRADTDTPEPLAKLAKGFNFMADQVQQNLNDKEAMIAAIPHELQTPLSRLRFLLELSKKKDTVSALRSSMDDIEDNFGELENAVSEILELVRIKNSGTEKQLFFDLHNFLKPIAAYYSQHESIELSLHCTENVPANAHDELISRAIHNLIQNALNYAKSQCLVSARVTDSDIIVSVEDDGPGIPEISRQKLLAAFSRLDKSRSQSTGGLGLGLALVKTIMDQHNGKVDIQDSKLGGALVELRWPKLARHG